MLLLVAVAMAEDVDAGARLAGLGACEACHTGEGGAPYAGGHAVETRFGTFYGPNLTQDPEHGLGAWDFEDFVGAMRRGRSPDGHVYYPAFPYVSYTALTDADLRDLWAYLRTIPPDPTPDRDHDVRFPYGWRALLHPWRWLAFDRGPYTPDPDRDAAWNRGAYLGEGIGHCGECHTPRNGLGVPRRRHALSGSDDPPEPAPNVTPHDDGIGDWSEADLVTFFESGMGPDGDFAGGFMRHIVTEGTAALSDDDRRALVTWLRSIPPRPDAPDDAPGPDDPDDGETDDEDAW